MTNSNPREHHINYWSNAQCAGRDCAPTLAPLTPGQYIGYGVFMLLTGGLFLFSLIWWALAAMRI